MYLNMCCNFKDEKMCKKKNEKLEYIIHNFKTESILVSDRNKWFEGPDGFIFILGSEFLNFSFCSVCGDY